jgi:hypothetical protein
MVGGEGKRVGEGVCWGREVDEVMAVGRKEVSGCCGGAGSSFVLRQRGGSQATQNVGRRVQQRAGWGRGVLEWRCGGEGKGGIKRVM